MIKTFKKILCTLLVVVMCLTSVPLSGFVGLGATVETTEHKVGDIVQFGSYPQTEVKDETLIAELNALAPEWDDWISYGYYDGIASSDNGTGTLGGACGTMKQGDWMKYTDVVYNENQYRAVMFTQYRPRRTIYRSSIKDSYQDDNGYSLNKIYWFKYESLNWRVLDPVLGFIMCENIIDSQAYSNTIYYYNNTYYKLYNDPLYTNVAGDYKTSSIRKWLNNDFYYTAFTETERSEINTTCFNDSGEIASVEKMSNQELDFNETKEKIFLLSSIEAKYSDFGFDSFGFKSVTRQAQGSDYAKCQGLKVSDSKGYEGNSSWLFRTIYVDDHTLYASSDGKIYSGNYVADTADGIRPALTLGRLPDPVESGNLSFTSETYEMYVGSNSTTDNNNITLKYTVEKAEDLDDFNMSDITLTAGDSSYLRVNKCINLGVSNEGKTLTAICDVKALKIGETTLTATFGDVGSTSCNITMIPPNELGVYVKDSANYYSAERYFFDENGNYTGDYIEIDYNIKNKLREESAIAIVEQAIKDGLKIKNIKLEFTLSGTGLVFDETKSTTLTKEYDCLELYDSETEKLKIICTNPEMLDSVETVKGKLSYKVYFDDLVTGVNKEKGTDSVEFSVQSYKRKYVTEHVFATSDDKKFKPILTKSFARQMKGLEETGDFIWSEVMSKGLIDNAVSLFTDFDEVNAYEIVIADILSLLNSSNREEQSQMFGGAFFDFCSAIYDSLISFYGATYIADLFEALGGEKGKFTLNEITDIVSNKVTSGPAYNAFEKLISNNKWANTLDDIAVVGKVANTALTAYGIVKDTVNGIQKAAVISSACKAYEDMIENNKDVFEKLKTQASSDGNTPLAKALGNYINYNNSSAMQKIANGIAATVVNGGGTGIQVGVLALANAVSQGTVETVVGVIGSVVAGFDCGRLLSNILCNSSDYAEASCAAVASGYISESLLQVIVDLQAETALASDINTAFSRAQTLDFAFRMYKAVENIAYDKTVDALNAEGSSIVIELLTVDVRKEEYKTTIADLLNKKACIQNVTCHDTSLAGIYSKIIDLGYSSSGNVTGNTGSKYKVLCVQCPVDVIITNSEGQVVAEIINDKIISKVEGVDVVVYEDEKYICVPNTDEYNIIITATDSGKMDYTVYEYNENGDNVREIEYNDISLYIGQKFSGKVGKENFESSNNYNLVTDSKTIYADKDNYKLSEGHEYTAEVVKATCTSNGIRKYTCTCGDEYTEIIPATGHSYSFIKTDATCTANGVVKYTCACNNTYAEVVPAKGHSFADGQSKCSNCDYNKADSCSCRCHKTSIIARIIWKFMIFLNKLLKRNQICSCGIYHY